MTTHAAPSASDAPDTPGLAQDRSRYLAASGVALWGAQLAVVAIPLTAVASLSAGAAETALLAATAAVPFMLLGLHVGAWLDRVKRRPVMIAADVVRAIGLATVPLAAWLDILTFTQLWLVVLVNGIATVFFDLGTQSHLKDLAPAGHLVRMNGRLATITQSALVCAPPLAGWAAGILSPTAVIAATACGYAWSAVWLHRLRTPEPMHGKGPARTRLLADIAEGLRFVRRQPVLLAVLGAGCLVNFGTAAFMAVLPVRALTELGWTESQLGLFLGAGGVGGLLGALTANRVSGVLGAGRSILIIGLIMVPVAAVLPFAGTALPGYVAAGSWALIIYKVGFDAVLMMSFRQAITPSGLLGRVNGTMRVFLTASVAAGAAAAGFVATAAGSHGAVILAAVALGLVWLPIALSPLPRLASLKFSP